MYQPIENNHFYECFSEKENESDNYPPLCEFPDYLKANDLSNFNNDDLNNNSFPIEEMDNFCEQTTKFKTNINELLNSNNVQNYFGKNISEESLFHYSFEKIQELFRNNEKLSKFLREFWKSKEIEKAEVKLTNQKRKRKKINQTENDKINAEEVEETNRIKRGRKANPDEARIEHNKMSPDNIIKKIKAHIFAYCLKFLNTLLNKDKKDKIKLYKLDYRFINKLKKEIDLNFLKSKLKDLFSLDITEKHKKIPKDMNKNLIEKIIKKEEYVEDYETVMFAFEMTLSEWLLLFTCKKCINDIINNKSISSNSINIEKIRANLIKADDLLSKISKKNNKKYLSTFIYYLYNYECYFETKVGRVLKTKEKKEESK